ncbi:MAG: hypothetical protein Q3993_06740 [Filifactor alocis]|nr:hypothetical protein [Filifactor alocis]
MLRKLEANKTMRVAEESKWRTVALTYVLYVAVLVAASRFLSDPFSLKDFDRLFETYLSVTVVCR